MALALAPSLMTRGFVQRRAYMLAIGAGSRMQLLADESSLEVTHEKDCTAKKISQKDQRYTFYMVMVQRGKVQNDKSS